MQASESGCCDHMAEAHLDFSPCLVMYCSPQMGLILSCMQVLEGCCDHMAEKLADVKGPRQQQLVVDLAEQQQLQQLLRERERLMQQVLERGRAYGEWGEVCLFCVN